METEIGQQAPQVQQLSEENKTKVVLIADVNSINRLLYKGRNLSTHEFNTLYDAPIRELEQFYYNLRHQYNMMSVVI